MLHTPWVWTNVQQQGSIIRVSHRVILSPTPSSLSSASLPPHPQQHWSFLLPPYFCLWRVDGVIHPVMFSNWLPSLGNTHWGFVYIFSQLDNSMLSSSDCCSRVWVYPATHLQTFPFSPAMNGTSCCPTSLPALHVVSDPDFGHSNRCCRFLNLLK